MWLNSGCPTELEARTQQLFEKKVKEWKVYLILNLGKDNHNWHFVSELGTTLSIISRETEKHENRESVYNNLV